MTPKQKAEELVSLFQNWYYVPMSDEMSKEYARLCVSQIILANPHSNPLNTDVYPTTDYWVEVRKELGNMELVLPEIKKKKSLKS